MYEESLGGLVLGPGALAHRGGQAQARSTVEVSVIVRWGVSGRGVDPSVVETVSRKISTWCREAGTWQLLDAPRRSRRCSCARGDGEGRGQDARRASTTIAIRLVANGSRSSWGGRGTLAGAAAVGDVRRMNAVTSDEPLGAQLVGHRGDPLLEQCVGLVAADPLQRPSDLGVHRRGVLLDELGHDHQVGAALAAELGELDGGQHAAPRRPRRGRCRAGCGPRRAARARARQQLDVLLEDGDEHAGARAEVVVDGAAVALPGLPGDLEQRRGVDAVLGEAAGRGDDQPATGLVGGLVAAPVPGRRRLRSRVRRGRAGRPSGRPRRDRPRGPPRG